MIQQIEEVVAVAIREDHRGFFRETNFIQRDDDRLANADFRLAHLIDDDRGIGKPLRQTNTRRNAGFFVAPPILKKGSGANGTAACGVWSYDDSPLG